MRLPDLRKILREDVKTKESWISAITENIKCQIKEVSLQTSSAYPTMEPIKFQSTLGAKAVGLWVVQAYISADFVPVTSPVYAAWNDNNGTINVTFVSGLAASERYTVRFLLF